MALVASCFSSVSPAAAASVSVVESPSLTLVAPEPLPRSARPPPAIHIVTLVSPPRGATSAAAGRRGGGGGESGGRRHRAGGGGDSDASTVVSGGEEEEEEESEDERPKQRAKSARQVWGGWGVKYGTQDFLEISGS